MDEVGTLQVAAHTDGAAVPVETSRCQFYFSIVSDSMSSYHSQGDRRSLSKCDFLMQGHKIVQSAPAAGEDDEYTPDGVTLLPESAPGPRALCL